MMNKRTALRTLGALALTALAACAATPVAPTNVAETLARTPELSTLNRLVTDAGLADTLRGPGPFTLFAPSDDAFKALPPEALARLTADRQALRSVLSYHLLPSKVDAGQVAGGNAKTVQGASVALSRSGTFVTVEDAVVQTADLQATNGVIHVVDRVLMPPKT